MKILAYQRSPGSPWLPMPKTSPSAAQRFLLLGAWSTLRWQDASGTVHLLSKEASR